MSAHSPEEVHDVLMAAFTAGDVEGFVRTYEEDATLVVPPDEVLVHGRDEIRRAVAPTFALKPRGEATVLKKLESDGLALTQARWRLVGTGEDGQTIELTGDGTIVSRRQPDGSWKVVLDNPLRPPVTDTSVALATDAASDR